MDARLRYPFEHSTMKLPGAVRVAPQDTSLPALPRGRDIVVYDSDPVKEYEETCHKARGMQKAVQLAARGLELNGDVS